MFGLGYMEIGLILLLVIILFGGRRTGRMLGKTYDTYQKVGDAKRKFSLGNLLGLGRKDK